MKKIKLCILTLFIAVILPLQNGWTQSDSLIFDDKTYYDIYLVGEGQTIIRGVKILKQIEVGQKTFIVIEPSDFNLNESRGFINFDNVSAILPAHKYRVESGKSLKFWK